MEADLWKRMRMRMKRLAESCAAAAAMAAAVCSIHSHRPRRRDRRGLGAGKEREACAEQAACGVGSGEAGRDVHGLASPDSDFIWTTAQKNASPSASPSRVASARGALGPVEL